MLNLVTDASLQKALRVIKRDCHLNSESCPIFRIDPSLNLIYQHQHCKWRMEDEGVPDLWETLKYNHPFIGFIALNVDLVQGVAENDPPGWGLKNTRSSVSIPVKPLVEDISLMGVTHLYSTQEARGITGGVLILGKSFADSCTESSTTNSAYPTNYCQIEFVAPLTTDVITLTSGTFYLCIPEPANGRTSALHYYRALPLGGALGSEQGPQGEAGKSAYESWIALGNTGTEAEFIASLKGATGEQGPQGPAGEQGPQGEPGPAGETGTLDDWLLISSEI